MGDYQYNNKLCFYVYSLESKSDFTNILDRDQKQDKLLRCTDNRENAWTKNGDKE
jgi:hypothetical protein